MPAVSLGAEHAALPEQEHLLQQALQGRPAKPRCGQACPLDFQGPPLLQG
eukprot:CAMPEP_0173439096 /NCGR_PEP_ID=MMETSP1357-20121228/20764_1 /TAXON_ID=77926 /ORGANISM="Hemiselmis rufescens, Strain PCC563" /LENGTH=49 /DNA_ID= /DNA_START= /DNA_END= /DNA_ORIENTATION=